MNARRHRYPPVALAALLGLALAAGAAGRIASTPGASTEAMQRAASLMAQGIVAVRQARLEQGLAINPWTDPNRTGLIGSDWSPITTTLGSLLSKRTSTNPNMAAGLTRWLHEAGVREGSVVAIGASGSFPALALGTRAAALALGARPVSITSLGSSSWGANEPEFTWLDMEVALERAGLGPRSVAASLGGEDDEGAGLSPDARHLLLEAVRRSGVPLLEGATLQDRVTARMAAYDVASGGRIAAFVNIGGALANAGTCPGMVNLRPGVHRTLPPCRGTEGVMWRMNARGIVIVHLLHADGIAAEFHLPVDPVPLPEPGRGAPFAQASRQGSAAVLMAFLACLLALVRKGIPGRIG